MCGRVTLTLTIQEVAEILNIKQELDWTPRYNIAPTQQIPVVIDDEEKQIKLFQWGLIPHWAKDHTMGSKLINARAETIDAKPSFKHCFKSQRCLILADGFYEWKREGQRKTPYRFILKDRQLFGFAGIWDHGKNAEGKIVQTCSIITTGPNALMSSIHDRMPVILKPEHEQIWLDPTQKDSDQLKSMLTPYPPELMEVYPVSAMVNSAKYDTIECIQPVQEPLSLFS